MNRIPILVVDYTTTCFRWASLCSFLFFGYLFFSITDYYIKRNFLLDIVLLYTELRIESWVCSKVYQNLRHICKLQRQDYLNMNLSFTLKSKIILTIISLASSSTNNILCPWRKEFIRAD